MNESLQVAIQELISRTLSGVDTSIAFLNQEMPDYIFELLLWYGVYNGVLFIVFIFTILFYIALLRAGYKWYKDNKSEIPNDLSRYEEEKLIEKNESTTITFVVLSLIFTCAALIITINTVNLIWLQILISPKVWLIEYAGTLLK